MSARLQVVPLSPPCIASEAGLRAAGIAYERELLPPGLTRSELPALELGGQRVSGGDAILRHAGHAVGSAETQALADALEPATERIAWAAIRLDPRALRSYLGEGARFVPRAAMILPAARRAGADDMTVRDDMHVLPEQLDHADELIAAEPDSAAALRVAGCVRLLLTLGDVRPSVDGRPCAARALALLPSLPGSVPSRLMPDNWLPATVTV